MKIIRPIATLCDSIVSSNVTLEHPVYDATTTYSKDDYVVDTACGASVYKSLANANTGNSPATSSEWWVKTGTSNYYALFDNKISTQTQRAESIEYEAEFTGLVNAIALINVEANAVRFEAWNAADEKVIDQVVSLKDIGRTSLYDYYTRPLEYVNRYVNFKLPTLRSGKGKLTLSRPGGIAKIGALVYGSKFVIGESQWGVTVGIQDYSIKETDDFGNHYVVERGFQDKMDVDVVVDSKRTFTVKQELTKFRANPTIWVADESMPETITFGYYKDFSIILPHSAFNECSLQILGLS